MQSAQAGIEMSAEPIVYVVDDDLEMREALLDLFIGLGRDRVGAQVVAAD